MTEAMSRREIEDVLSSIRRIVSHDVHPTAAPAPQGASHDKLLLTSALRVDAVMTDASEDELPPVADDGLPSGATDASDETAVAPVLVHDAAAPNRPASSLLARISTASMAPSMHPAPVPDSDPAMPQTDIHTSIEDSALEATLARLEAALATTVQPDLANRPSEDATATDDEIIDEGVLYQIVAHIVRQELQGELGEKITRNIRKLVRSEVARELELRKF